MAPTKTVGELQDMQRQDDAAELPEMPKRPPVKSILRVPSDGEFGDDDFFVSSALASRARVLIERHPEYFEHLADYRLSVTYLWKKVGGKSKGRGVFGKTTKPAGLLKLFSEATFVIWLAADHCRGAGYGDREIEALLFHEMLHTAEAEEDEETGRGGGPTLVPHELEIFRAEVEVYGFWADDIKQAAPAFRQGNLFEAPVTRAAADSPAAPGDDEHDLSDLPDDAEVAEALDDDL